MTVAWCGIWRCPIGDVEKKYCRCKCMEECDDEKVRFIHIFCEDLLILSDEEAEVLMKDYRFG